MDPGTNHKLENTPPQTVEKIHDQKNLQLCNASISKQKTFRLKLQLSFDGPDGPESQEVPVPFINFREPSCRDFETPGVWKKGIYLQKTKM